MALEHLREKKYNATLVSIQEFNYGLRIFRIKPDDAKLKYAPGQFVSIGLWSCEKGVSHCKKEGDTPEVASLLKRPYSISHPMTNKMGKLVSEGENNYLEFYIVLVSVDGDKLPTLTPRLFALKEGSRLFMGKPVGHYILEEEEVRQQKHLIFCATGTGEAPHNSMVAHLLQNGYTAPLTAIICTRKYEELAYRCRYEDLCASFPNLTYIHLTTREKGTPKVYIQDLLKTGELEKRIGETICPQRHSFYLCGNPAMIGIPKRNALGERVYPSGAIGMVELLEKKGLMADEKKDKGEVHFEKYW